MFSPRSSLVSYKALLSPRLLQALPPASSNINTHSRLTLPFHFRNPPGSLYEVHSPCGCSPS
jgi:hypothetical protein